MSAIVRIISTMAAAMFLWAGAAACSSSTEDTKADGSADTTAVVDETTAGTEDDTDDVDTGEDAQEEPAEDGDGLDGDSVLAELYGADANWCDIANAQETDIDDVDLDAGFAALEELMESPEKLEAGMNAMVELAPDEIKGDVQTLADFSKKFFSDGMSLDFSSGEIDPEFEAMMEASEKAQANIDAYNAAHC